MKTLSATLWHGLYIYLFRFYKIKFGIFFLNSDRATREKTASQMLVQGKMKQVPETLNPLTLKMRSLER